MKAILGKKIGMTRVFNSEGNPQPVTLIEAGPCWVTQLKALDEEGYNAVQIGYELTKKLNKTQKGHLKDNKTLKNLKEFLVKKEELESYKLGEEISVDKFQIKEKVDVQGISKGKGFAGHVKRHHFHTGPKTHGSDNYRQPGSIGSTYPQRTVKGRRMAGHLGARQNTIKNLEIIDIIKDKNILVVKGSVPGSNKSLLFIQGKS